jgi:fatty acid desaturase
MRHTVGSWFARSAFAGTPWWVKALALIVFVSIFTGLTILQHRLGL